jgi:hypothetical protein
MANPTRSAYRRWLMKYGVISFALVMATAFFNLLVDGVGIFHFHKGLKYAAANLIQGKMVAGPMGVYEEREFQRLVIEQYKGQRDMIAIGSSRTQSVRKRFIDSQIDFFNHSVSGVCVEDFVAIIGIYKEKGILPKTVMLGIDPWVFNKNNGLPAGWKILDHYYREMIPEFANSGSSTKPSMKTFGARDTLGRYKQLINLEYTLQNWKYLREGKALYVTDTTNVDDFIREPDGSMHFPYKMRFAKQDEGFDGPINGPPEQYFNNFNRLYGTDLLEELVKYLITNDTKVIFLLPPLHPIHTALQMIILEIK